MDGSGSGGTTVGSVERLARFPLRAAAAEWLAEVLVGPSGLLDDRRWVVLDGEDQPVSGADAPWLRQVAVQVVDGELTVDMGDGELRTRGDAAAALTGLAAAAGAGTDLAAVRIAGSTGHRAGVEPVHLVSAGAQSAPDAPDGCDPDPRANLVLTLDAPGAERGWTGRQVQVGEVVLEVTGTPRRCLGVYARVLGPGRVRVGDPVVLLPPAPPPGSAAGPGDSRR